VIKKIAVINDLSGFGRCSLTAAIPVLSAMGIQACPLPTAILTAQTGYPSYYCDSYTEKMDYFRVEWEKMQVHFAGIYTGFVSEEKQLIKIFDFLDTFHHQDAFLLVDPVMGDDGAVYGMYNEKLREHMKNLVYQADYTTPNLTELCLLTDNDFHKLPPKDDSQGLLDIITIMGKSLCEKGTGNVIVTGIHFIDSSGQPKIGNVSITSNSYYVTTQSDLGASYSGTGDLFASVLTGGIARGDTVEESMEKAVHFLQKGLKDSITEQVPLNDGINFEKYLSILVNKEE